MKPFNLEKAIAGKPLITRDGRDAKFIAYVQELKEGFRLLVFITGEGSVASFCDGGMYLLNREDDWDLFMKPEKKTVWVNYYPEDGLGYVYSSQERADYCGCLYRAGDRAQPVDIDI